MCAERIFIAIVTFVPMKAIITKDVVLAPYTTLGIGGNAEYFAMVKTEEDLHEVVLWAESKQLPITIIGGGSNILVPDEGIAGLVIHNALGGITYSEHGSFVHVRVGSGVTFDTLIEELVSNELWGLENLSAIPGTVGGVPIQNVGAYGVEASDVIVRVDAYNLNTKECIVLDNTSCAFTYRDSFFKHEEGKLCFVTNVTFRVSREPSPQVTYRDLALQFANDNAPTIRQVREAVCAIRKNKFPDWRNLGTAGSFFKNPIVRNETYAVLHEKYPDLPAYIYDDQHYKIALGWILDHVLALKGFREGNVGLYERQALVLINHGGGTAKEVLAFSDSIMQKIFDATGIHVEREVIVIEK
jgi:UDP-N-acetylmuramate dehydrogenase